MPTLKRPGRLVVDANPILSALLGGAASRIFFEGSIEEFAATEEVLREVQEHLPAVAARLGVREDFLQLGLDLLPLTSYPESYYRRKLPEARRRIGKRDPDDVATLALALALDIPLWSNDRDFEGLGIPLYTTPQLLRLLFPDAPR